MLEYLFNYTSSSMTPTIITITNRSSTHTTIGYTDNADFHKFNRITGLLYLPICKTGSESPYDFTDIQYSSPDDWNSVDKEWCFVSRFHCETFKSFYTKKRLLESEMCEGFMVEGMEDVVEHGGWYKGGYDAAFRHGDGGLNYYVFPVYVQPVLDVSSGTRLRFLQGVSEMNEELKDWHEDEPVEDVVDPNLHPYLFDEEDVDDFAEVMMRLSTTFRRRFVVNEIKYEIVPAIKDGTFTEPESLRLRRGMQWIPSEFVVRKNGDVSISSSINNLPPHSRNKGMYKCISRIFKAMVPGFKRLNLINEDKDTNLQVIVKIQNYRIPPGGSYKGHWHLEGETENIVASGIYYPRVDTEICGGELKLRPKKVGDMSSGNNRSLILPVQEGTSIVFSNTLPHRFEPITNPNDREANRTFITFFIVDPKKPIVSTKSFMPADEIRLNVQNWMSGTFGVDLPHHIWANIWKYLPNRCSSLKEAKEFRSRIRNGLSETRSGWGYTHYGNCGEMTFIPTEKYNFEYESDFLDTISHEY
eukprot:TRINITY_DN1600_c0_g1_i1.p1 TRINITY_DN1600_c0_g1~~TRINITY_DN1600_c0_g1_i1.p1  ORF type:complete len:537 (+),score=92.57 TRINITY_DN1600_c0_g1_i1:25-1611(+)